MLVVHAARLIKLGDELILVREGGCPMTPMSAVWV